MRYRLLLLILGLLSITGVVSVRSAQAAAPLTLSLTQAEAFRHVLEAGDWLVLARLYLTPLSQTGLSDSFTVTTTSGDFNDPVVLTNRVVITSDVDFTVTADAVTDITAFCTLGQDDQTINCEGTGLADASHAIVVEYRSGWSAYAPDDVFVRLNDDSTTPTVIMGERGAANTGYALVGIYLTAADVAGFGATWGDSDITLVALASPNLWAVPATQTAPIVWQSTADHAATVITLTARLNNMLVKLEQDDPAVASGAFVALQGITNAGGTVAARAFRLITTAIPNAFLTSVVNPFPTAVRTPQASMAFAQATAIAGTTTYTNFQAIHSTAGLIITLLGSIVLGGFVWTGTKSVEIATVVWWIAMLGGWLLFAIPMPLVFIPAAGIVGFGFLAFARKVFA